MSSLSRLTALIGPARVKDIIFTARLVGAEEAAAAGLLTEVVEDLPALQRRADELATLIAGHAPLTLTATKQALARLRNKLTREEGEDLILMCYMSRDFREGLRRVPRQASAAMDGRIAMAAPDRPTGPLAGLRSSTSPT